MSAPENTSRWWQNLRFFASREQVEEHFQMTSPEYVEDLMKLHDEITVSVLATLSGKT